MFNVYLTGVGKRDAFLQAFARGCESKSHDHSKTLIGGTSVFWGLDHEEQSKIQECREKGKKFVFLDHAYFRRGYNLGWARVCINWVHQTGLLDVPDDRVKKLELTLEPWKKGREVIVIKPSEKICQLLGVSLRWANETALKLHEYTDRPIRIKEKGAGLLGELKDCHAVVGLSSVAEVEAARWGIPVFAGEYSPASPVAESDFSKIETPIYPDRDMWLRTLSYSQWNQSEMSDGTTTRHLQRVLNGDFNLCRAPDGGK